MHADWVAVVYMQYDPESAPALALKATMERTEKRFANYAKAGLLCGADGLPHLISDPGLALKYGHAGEVFVSTKTLSRRLFGTPTHLQQLHLLCGLCSDQDGVDVVGWAAAADR